MQDEEEYWLGFERWLAESVARGKKYSLRAFKRWQQKEERERLFKIISVLPAHAADVSVHYDPKNETTLKIEDKDP